MAHARRFSSRTNSARRRVSWAGGPGGRSGVISASSVTLFPVASEAALDDLTLVRIRGDFEAALISADAVNSGFEVAMGIANVSQNAAGIGVTAVPDPLVDIAWDGWIWHETFFLLAVDSSPSPSSYMANLRRVIDNKAMCKTHATDNLVALISVTEFGTATMFASLACRVLDKLA